jgi:predicted RNA methylase
MTNPHRLAAASGSGDEPAAQARRAAPVGNGFKMIEPAYVSDDGSVTLYCADCRAILPTLAAGSVDAIVTDPPYGIKHVTSHGASWEGTQIANDDTCEVRDYVLAWAGERPWACWGSYKTVPPKKFKAKIVWDKGPAFGAGDLSFPWKPSFEECWFSPGPWRGESREEGVWRGPVLVSWESFAGGREHPHQKPDWLFAKVINALPSAFVICDPCMGVGTTGVAAVRLGRKFIGIEIEPKYFEIAKRRIVEELARFEFLDPKPREPERLLFTETPV